MNTIRPALSLTIDDINVDVRIAHFNTLYNVMPSSFNDHTHTSYEAYFIEDGEMIVECGEDTKRLQANDIFIIFPDTSHRIISHSNDIRRVSFRFLCKDDRACLSDGYTFYLPSDEIRADIFHNISCIFRHITESDLSFGIYRIKACLGIIISYIIRDILGDPEKPSAQTRSASTPTRLDRLITLDRFFSEHYSEHITIDALAKELHYSKTHINRLLNEYWGVSFSEKLAKTRIEKAQRLLVSSSLSINQISEKCGYSTLRGFEIFFKNHTGMLPLRYRLIHRAKKDIKN